MATGLNHIVKIGYWDTAQGNPPSLVGQIRGTPTIKYIYPSKKNSKRSNREKIVSDYQQAREVGPMRDFAVSRMPSFVERLKTTSDLEKFLDKANKFGLPKMILFSKKAASVKPIYKALSTEYRRRILIAQVKESATDAALILEHFNVKRFPALIAVDAGSDEHVSAAFKKKSTWNALNTFIFEHALPKPYFDMPKKSEEHTEL